MDAADARLAALYQTLPYPQRDPAEERRRLLIGSPSLLREIDHWVFGAARSRDRPLRVLVAGGGTGDATIMLAEQMREAGQPGHVTHLDRSPAALAVAAARASMRELDVTFREGSLLDPPATPETFDYIDCVGVLHHLADPLAGLSALLAVLAPGGGLGLMVYAPHGRTGVYMVQDALRHLAPADRSLAERLDVARRVWKHLPAEHWLRHNRAVTDHLHGGDAGLADLLLNPRDQAFTIDEFLRLLDQAGLAATCLLEPLRYDPAAYLPDPRLREAAAGLDQAARAALAEAVSGRMSTHVVYATRREDVPPRPDPTRPDAVPITRTQTGEALAQRVSAQGTMPFVCEALSTLIPLPSLAAALLRRVDGQASVADILGDLGPKAPAAWADLFARLNAANLLLLAPPRGP